MIGRSIAVGVLSLVAAAATQSRGDRLFAQGAFQEARVAYTVALRSNPNEADAKFKLGTLELYDNDVGDAIKDLAFAAKAHVARASRLLAVARERERRYVISIPQSGTTIPFEITDPLPMVRVTVDGRPADFLIDTGAPDIVLDVRFAKQLQLPIANAGMGTFAGGRRAPVEATTVPSFVAGSASVRNFPARVIPIPMLMSGHRIAGIIGTGFLYQFLATLDYVRGELRLLPKSDSATFESKARTRALDAEQMWLVGDHFIFAAAHVNDAPEGLFNIDTGGAGFGLQLTKGALDAAHIKVDTTHVETGMGGGGQVASVPFLADVTLSHTTVKGVRGMYFRHGDQYGVFPFAVAGSISHAFFRHTSVTFDFGAMRLVLGAT